RDRQRDDDGPQDRRVDGAAEIAGDRAEDQPEGEAHRDGDDADDEREPRAVDDPRQLVAADLVDPEPVRGRGAGAAAVRHLRVVLLERGVRREQRREYRSDDEEADEEEADLRATVPPDLYPRLMPQPPR